MIDWYVSAGRSWEAMAEWTDRGDICPRARRWFSAVAGPAGTGAWGAGVRSLGIPGCKRKAPGCSGGKSSRGVSTRVGEAGCYETFLFFLSDTNVWHLVGLACTTWTGVSREPDFYDALYSFMTNLSHYYGS